ncbi:hypothetical protein ACQZ4Q_23340 [Agrobacterium vitis]
MPQPPGRQGFAASILLGGVAGRFVAWRISGKADETVHRRDLAARESEDRIRKPSIWGSLDPRMAADRLPELDLTDEPAAIVADDRSCRIVSNSRIKLRP